MIEIDILNQRDWFVELVFLPPPLSCGCGKTGLIAIEEARQAAFGAVWLRQLNCPAYPDNRY